MNTPSDEEILLLAQQHLKAFAQFSSGEVWLDGEVKFARAVLAKWGHAASGAGEPVAWLDPWTGAKVTTDYDAYGKHGIPLYTAPQPVACEPLTCEWTHNDDDGYWDTSCGKAWRFDDGGPKENNMNFCHCCGKTLRIKGGQHGADN